MIELYDSGGAMDFGNGPQISDAMGSGSVPFFDIPFSVISGVIER